MADVQGSIVFAINGEKHTLSGANWQPGMTLNEYIRRYTPYKGTKLSCGEGGCGACAVTLSRTVDDKEELITVNSCLRPLASVDGWSVTTTEGLCQPNGDLHPVQQRIADFHGSQCGFCTPGMVMTTYAALRQHPEIKKACMEKQFDGNLCRCTGYRPILDAAKSFAVDVDIEEIAGRPCFPKPGPYDPELDPRVPKFLQTADSSSEVRFSANGVTWVRPVNLAGALKALSESESARAVAGNTSVGIYKEQEAAQLRVDIHRVPELRAISSNAEYISVGGACSLTELLNELHKHDNASPQCAHLPAIIERVVGIANVHVRNSGTVAGNLIMAKSLGFLSDLSTTLLGADATVVWVSAAGQREESMERFLAEPAVNRGELIQAIRIPFVVAGAQYHTYKSALRRVNAHAFINAGMYVRFEADNDTVADARLAFGGVMPDDVPGTHAVRATDAEQVLIGSKISDGATFSKTLKVIQKQLNPTSAKADYRRGLVRSFFYRFFLKLRGENAPPEVRSGADMLPRGLSSGSQTFQYDEAKHAPVSKPIPKLSSRAQAAGSSQYTDDIPLKEGTQFAALVTSTVAHGKLVSVDASRALALDGVLAVVTHEDIKGKNNVSPVPWPLEALVTDKVGAQGLPIAVVVAASTRLAEQAAKLVDVKYDLTNAEPLVITARQAAEAGEKLYVPGAVNTIGDAEKADKALGAAKNKHSLEVEIGSQPHFYMEPLVAYAVPEEDNDMVVYAGCQWPDSVHTAITNVLGVAANRVRFIHRRCGGGFGGKHVHAAWVAALAALACQRTRRPVRLTLNRNVDMALVGGREEVFCKYTMSHDDDGKLGPLRMDMFMASGCSTDFSFFSNMALVHSTIQAYQFDKDSFVESHLSITNTADRTVMRGPGEIAGCYLIETVMEQIAHATGQDPHVVREKNLYPPTPAGQEAVTLINGKRLDHYSLPLMWQQAKDKTNFEARLAECKAFNAKSRWRKHGISIVPVRYEVSIWPKSATINIYGDGSIICHHGCTEIGQGAHVKVSQVVAYELGRVFGDGAVPLDVGLIRHADLDSHVLPNQSFTGGSTGSEGAAEASRLACKILVERLKPVLKGIQSEKEKKGDENFLTVTWPELCAAAKGQSIDLSAHDHWSGAGERSCSYQNYGAAVTEVMVDVLTGETEVLKATILYDCGKSLNPAIDIGQAEGAFVQGLGHVFREEVLIDETGKLISDGTWEMKPPSYRCIPERLEIDMLKDSPFDKGVLSSKASGEPPLVLAVSAAMAARMAIASARADADHPEFFSMPLPITVDTIQQLCLTQDEHLVL
eukprot:CAMPEP_0177646408 /NCGR_PEP_ID=MMETSP0447-20121125/9759_1 /TAXON_ID=0 /ORGANISM="Stygamoeba regulata, Strain BSH-02190019" /LENGTH=1301 /DNA_ID=CAMNT_0019148941 /DNA_START=93 /DNA_END=3998 /DNA_ORIENTATION=+